MEQIASIPRPILACSYETTTVQFGGDPEALGGVGFTYQRTTFECIVEGTRHEFTSEESECLKKCFEDLDEFAMDYICLYEVDSACYKSFVRASEAGLQRLKDVRDVATDAQVTDAFVSYLIKEWEQLLIELRRDPRY
jgi:hypothetical protein